MEPAKKLVRSIVLLLLLYPAAVFAQDTLQIADSTSLHLLINDDEGNIRVRHKLEDCATDHKEGTYVIKTRTFVN